MFGKKFEESKKSVLKLENLTHFKVEDLKN